MIQARAVLGAVAAIIAVPATAAAEPLGADACVALALRHSARVKVARADVEGLRAQAAQIESLLSVKISAVTFAAPIFKAEGGLGYDRPYQHDLGTWGPYAHVDGRIVKPLGTFGRYTAGVEAANERTAVGEERAREIANGVRAEVRRLYALRLYALSMKPNLENGKEILARAITKAEEMYAGDSGEVTLPDLMRLRYGAGEIERFLRMANDGIELATLALRQAMGQGLDSPLAFADDKLEPAEDEIAPLAALIESARQNRPELAQIRHGKAATAAWETAEQRANRPVLFVALAGQADWSPVRPHGSSGSLYNLYNDYFVGAAAGLKFDIDMAAASAKAAEARAKGHWVEANEALAATGIPLQVAKARQELVQHRDLSRVAEDEVKSTRKWMTFAAAAHASGTGEARDVLEGVAAYLFAKRAYYEHLLGAVQARTDLELAVGKP